MIILGQINFSEEQRLFGYWKKKNKELKKKELLEEFDKKVKYGVEFNPDWHVVERKKGDTYVKMQGDEKKAYLARQANKRSNAKEIGVSTESKLRNINQLINRRAEEVGETSPFFGQNSKLDPNSIRIGSKTRMWKKDKDGKKIKVSRSGFRKIKKGRSDLYGFTTKDQQEKFNKETGQTYRDYKEKLKDSIKSKEEKIKHLKKIKNLKKAGLITLGAAGTAAATYGGYKYLKNKNKKED